jgi:hypothetical protein
MSLAMKLFAKGWFSKACLDVTCALHFQEVSAEITVIGGLTREKVVANGQEYEGIVQLRNSGAPPLRPRSIRRITPSLQTAEVFWESPVRSNVPTQNG